MPGIVARTCEEDKSILPGVPFVSPHRDSTPSWHRLCRCGIATHQQNLQLVGLHRLPRRSRTSRPETESSHRETLLAKPEPLTVIHQNFHGGPPTIAEDE